MPFNKSNRFVASGRSWEETGGKLLEHLVKYIKKLESPTLYIQNHIPDLGETSSQVLASSVAYCVIHIRRNELRNQSSHQGVDVSRSLHTEPVQSSQRPHREHIAYTFSTSSLLLEVLVNYHFNGFDLRYLALAYKRHYILGTSIHTKDLKEASRKRLSFLNASSIPASMLMVSSTSKWRIIPPTCRYHCPCLNARFRVEIREGFHLSFCVLTTNEHRMHAQESAGENALSSYEMTWYPRISHA